MMKVVTLTQATKQHNTNRLHDAFIAAGLIPIRAESANGTSNFTFEDAVSDTAIQTVITNYVYVAPVVPADVKALWTAYATAMNNATTLAQAKTVLLTQMKDMLQYLALRDVANL